MSGSGQAKKTGDGRRKPTSTSVTSTQCTCGALQRAAEEPSIPIVFDARLNEYHIMNIGRDKGEEDLDVGLRTHSKTSDTEPTTITSYRTFTYKNLSKTADVVFTDYGSERGLRMTLRGKYLGEQT